MLSELFCKINKMFTIFLFTICTILVPSSSSTVPKLILTPLIEQNHTDTARNLSKVDPKLFLNLPSYSGYLTVETNSEVFFWYFPAQESVKDTPWILWLESDVGLSSLVGLFTANGPFEYVRNNSARGNTGYLKERKYTWNKKYSMVYLDNSVGSVFGVGELADQEMYTTHLNKAVKQLVQLYPELSKGPLYIAGEGFAGHFIPPLAMSIHENHNSAINLKGIMLGNPILGAESVADYASVFKNFGLIDAQGALAAAPLQKKYYEEITKYKTSSVAYALREDILNFLKRISGKSQLYNALKEYTDDDMNYYYADYISKGDVKEALHFGLTAYNIRSYTQLNNMKANFLANVTATMEKVLENYRVLIYCGQLSLSSPCVPNAEAIRKNWHWKHQDDFLKSPRVPWWFNDTIAGYIKSGGNLVEVLITNTGELITVDKPAELLHVVTNFIDNTEQNFVYPPSFLLKDFVNEPYSEALETEPKSNTTAFTASIVVNVVLILLLLLGAVFFLRYKKKVKQLYGPVSEGAMNMR